MRRPPLFDQGVPGRSLHPSREARASSRRTGALVGPLGRAALAQDELLDFAGSGQRELFDEGPVPGCLVGGEALPAVGEELLLAGHVSRGRADEGGYLLAPGLV